MSKIEVAIDFMGEQGKWFWELDYTRRARVARRIYCVGTTQIFLADATILEYVRSFELYPRGEISGETGMGKCDTRIVFVGTRFCKMS